jgi:hypothetical protein
MALRQGTRFHRDHEGLQRAAKDNEGAIRRAMRSGYCLGDSVHFAEAGSCIHLLNVCGSWHGDNLLNAVSKDMEKVEHLVKMHRSKKHLQIFGENMMWSKPFVFMLQRLLETFNMSLVDCWVNLYRHGGDMKSWHHDNYQDRNPRPTVTIGLSLGQTRDLGFQQADTGAIFRVPQQNGDIFAFDEPFNRKFKHSVLPEPDDSPGKRISVIVWANEQEQALCLERFKNPGTDPAVAQFVDWAAWEAQGIPLSKGARRRASEQNSEPDVSKDFTAAEKDGLLTHLATLASTRRWNRGSTSVLQTPSQSYYQVRTCESLQDETPLVDQALTQTRQTRWQTKWQTSEVRTISAEEMQLLDRALTLQGAQQVLAILRGKKLVENRSWRIPVGWYAIHAGAQFINEERALRISQAWPDAPPEKDLQHSALYGCFYVHSHRIPEELRPGYVWARGPVCHLISQAVEFEQPIPCSGGKGLWRIEVRHLEKVREQLSVARVRSFDLNQLFVD